MNITEPPKPSFLYLFFGTVIFLLLGVGALYYAVIVSIDVFEYLSFPKEIFVFEKSSFYLFGVGIGLLVYPFAIIYKYVFRLTVSHLMETYLSRIMIGSVILAFMLPQAMHFYIDSYTEKNNYQICRDESHRWLHVVTIVYAKEGRCQ